MVFNEAKQATMSTNPKLRALVKQIANLMDEARTEQLLLETLATETSEDHLQGLEREVDQRWHTIEQLARQLFSHLPSDLEEAVAQTHVGLALSNAGHWDEDPNLTAAARALIASTYSQPSDPELADALARIKPS